MRRKPGRRPKPKGSRSAAARRAWLTRTRNEGVKQLVGVVLSELSAVKAAKTVKDVAIGAIKVVRPDVYRRSRVLKKLDKML